MTTAFGSDWLFIREMGKRETIFMPTDRMSLRYRCVYALIYYSIESRFPVMLKDLINLGVSIDKIGDDGRTLLMRCIDSDDRGLIKLMVDLKADLNQKTPLAESALCYAVQRNKPNAVGALLKYGKGRVRLKYWGGALTHMALKKGFFAVANLLQNYGSEGATSYRENGLNLMHMLVNKNDTSSK